MHHLLQLGSERQNRKFSPFVPSPNPCQKKISMISARCCHRSCSKQQKRCFTNSPPKSERRTPFTAMTGFPLPSKFTACRQTKQTPPVFYFIHCKPNTWQSVNNWILISCQPHRVTSGIVSSLAHWSSMLASSAV